MTLLRDFLRDWLPYLIVAAVGMALISWSDRADAQSGDLPNANDPRCIDYAWDPAYYYCHEYLWGFQTDYWIPAVEIVDDGQYGFTMWSEADGPEANVHAEIVWEWDWFWLYGDVGGSTFRVQMLGTCLYQIYVDWPNPCGYWPIGLYLDEGWVLDNGIDFSNTFHEPAEQIFPPFVGGAGSEFPPYPYDPEDLPFLGLSHAHTDPVYEFPIEDYFGITVRIHTGSEETLATVPEPGMPVALGAGMAALGLIASRRRH